MSLFPVFAQVLHEIFSQNSHSMFWNCAHNYYYIQVLLDKLECHGKIILVIQLKL